MNDETRKAVAENVRRLREKMGMSVPEAANRVGVHRSYWNLLENATLNFTIEKLQKIADLLGVSVRDLFAEETGYAQASAPAAEKPRRKRRRAA